MSMVLCAVACCPTVLFLWVAEVLCQEIIGMKKKHERKPVIWWL